MHSFADPFGYELEKSLLDRMDFPFYHALACILIYKLCNEHYKDINKLWL